MIEYETPKGIAKSIALISFVVVGLFFGFFGIAVPLLSGDFVGQWSIWLGLEKAPAMVAPVSYENPHDCLQSHDSPLCFQVQRLVDLMENKTR